MLAILLGASVSRLSPDGISSVTKSGNFEYHTMEVTTVDTLLFAAPHSFLKRFALRLWQLVSGFAASSVPSPSLFKLTNAPQK